MREVETDNSVIWPSWCYNTGENLAETEPLKTRGTVNKSPPVSRVKKKRRTAASPEKRMNGAPTIISTSSRSPTTLSVFSNICATSTVATASTTTSAVAKMEVKSERLSPASGITDNNSSGSGSNTPSSSYPETPPGLNHNNERIPSPSLSPAMPLPHSKIMEQPLARNYSDIMRSLAAKYNNSNSNDYFNTSKNGLSGNFGDPRFTSFKDSTIPSPFANLVAPFTSNSGSPPPTLNACQLNLSSTNTKDSNNTDLKHLLNANDAHTSLFSNFGLNTFNSGTVTSAVNLPLFSPLIDMNSTQALLNMVRSANSNNINPLENYIKGAAAIGTTTSSSPSSTTLSSSTTTKRLAEIINNPLDLSSNAILCKKAKRLSSSSESFSCENLVPTILKAKDHHHSKHMGNLSPKPCTKSILPVPTAQPLLDRPASCLSLCTSSLEQQCPSQEGAENVSHWSIDDVCNFVSSIDICAEYVENFREQSIDGVSLPLLTEEHLRTTINMKLGPALKFRALLAQKIGHCNVCMHCMHCHARNGHSQTIPNSPAHPTTIVATRPNSTGN